MLITEDAFCCLVFLEYVGISALSGVISKSPSIRCNSSMFGDSVRRQSQTWSTNCSRDTKPYTYVMELSIKIHTIKQVWSLVYIEGSQVIISTQKCISCHSTSLGVSVSKGLMGIVGSISLKQFSCHNSTYLQAERKTLFILFQNRI